MEESPSEANSHLASQEIPCLLWNPNVHYCVHKSLPLIPIPSQMHPIPKSSHLHLGLLSGLYLKDFLTKFCIHFSSLLCMLYAPLISSSLT